MACDLCDEGEGTNGQCPGCRAHRARQAPAAAPARGDRRDPDHQYNVSGGTRQTDPPLTTRACAEWMGLSTDWIRGAIDDGVTVGGRALKLEAETITVNNRRLHRIHLDRFIDFLRAIGWSRIPKNPRDHRVPAAAAKRR